VTSGRSGGPSRDADAPTRTTWTRDGIGAIVAVLALGLVFRFILAQLNPGSGFSNDLTSFQFWASNLATQGFHGFYERDFFHDYTPGYLYVLYLVGLVGNAAGSIGDLIKIPPILADVALGWLIWSMVQEAGGSRRAGLIGAALVIFNPVSWYDSVLWGQVDSFGVVFLLLGVRALWRDRPERAAVYTVIAALIKPQLAILVPIVAVLTIRRALWPIEPAATGDAIAPLPSPAGMDRADEQGFLEPFRAWERRTGHPLRIVTTGLAGFLTAVVLCFPFGLSLVQFGNDAAAKPSLVFEMFKTAGEYPYASVNAYNPWALASIDGAGLAANGTWACDTPIPTPPPGGTFCPDAVMIGPIPAVYAGAALMLAAFVIVSLLVAWRPTRLSILVGVTVLAIAFFMLPTRVHERYLFPFIAVGAILAAASIRWRVAYVVLSLTTFLNMYAVLTEPFYKNPGVTDFLHLSDAIRSTTGVTLVVLAAIAATLWAFAQLRPGGLRALDDEIATGAEIDSGDAEWADEGRPATADHAGARGWATAAAGPGTGTQAADAGGAVGRGSGVGAAGAASLATAGAPLPTWSEPGSFAELGPIGWFRDRLNQRPVRADRSRALDGEPTGRFDRLDLWILVVLVVSILGIRMFRLSEPYQMHFDEVYHARTATEFLQGWRYGIDHDIYEWTHPHVAKYAMAGGLIAWGDDQVNATGDLGVPVLDAAIEQRYDDPDLPTTRAGDRVDVVTGSELRSYDLVTRALVASFKIDGAAAVAVDSSKHQLFVGSSDGTIRTLDLSALDAIREQGAGAPSSSLEPVQFGQVDGSIKRLFVPDDGSAVIVITADDQVRTLDPVSAEVLGTVQLKGVADVGPAGTAPTLTAAPGSVKDPKAAASTIAKIVGGSAATYQKRLAATGSQLVIAGISGSTQQTAVQNAIDDGRLAGMSISSLPQVAVADANGVEMINPASGSLTTTVDVGGPAHGLALSTFDDAKLWVSTDPDGTEGELGRIAIVAVGGDQAKNGPTVIASTQMPGPVSRVAYDEATQMIHALGKTPDDSASTIYVIEPHPAATGQPGAVYADARLPFTPAAWAIDVMRPYPTDDREEILVFDGSGSIASVDIGQHEFAWRLPGVIAGALMAGFLYALARILFRRRTVGLFVAVLCLADGMLFVQSRIGMNDAYVGLFIVAAYTLFAALWTGVWRHRGAFWIAMPLIGALLGLALASKWVGLYAILGMGFLILVRSALGRLLAIASLVTMTAVLGYLAINVPTGTGFGNLPFVAIMVALTVAAVVANVLHPLRWSLDEIRFAVGGPVAAGGLAALALIATNHAFKPATPAVAAAATAAPVSTSAIPFSLPMELAIGLVILGPLIWIGFAAAARIGFGPFAPPPYPDEPAALLPPAAPPPAAAWLRFGAQAGLPVVWMIGCIVILPVVLYVVSYIPWAVIDNHVLFPGWPAGHTGQTLIDLTGAMYNYHNGLTAAHPASSPWWAWLFDFKPVWFYQEGFAGNTTAAIYDAGNLVVWWLGLPALAFAAWQAFARRSLPLALITIGYAFQWVSWARIDRAAFQYHYYTSLPFLILALGYFLAELWHGASWRTWLLARMAAAVAILGPAVFWVLDRPLCGFVGVDKVNPNSQACPPVIPQFLLTTQTAALATIVGIAVLVVVRLFSRLGDEGDEIEGAVFVGDRAVSGSTVTLIQLGVTAVVAIGATWFAQTFIGDGPLISIDRIPVEPVAIVLGLPVLLIAAFIATARDARRFVIGALVAIVGWFVVVYPNISALPLPTAIANVYQGVLPTYLFAFQFPVNNVAATVKIELFGPVPLLLGASVVFLAVVVGYSAWAWRLSIAERLADERDAADLGSGLPRGAGGGAAGD
jgi:predicted membrane-bound dolichyl-phosphate-mannose-protein mannosyltransferase